MVRRGNIVLFGFQSIDDLFGGLLIHLSAFRVKIGQYLVQTLNADLYIINKVQRAPTNGWRFDDSPSFSSFLFIL
jgi:hypothetical protein